MPQKPITITTRKLGQNLGSLRQKDIVPGIMYGQSLKESLPIQIQARDLQQIIYNLKNTTTFFLDYEGTQHECILREYQTDRLHTHFLHVDFQYVKEDEIIKMQIPLAYEGLEFLNAKKLILEKFIPKVPVVGPIQDLPETLNIKVDMLNRGAKILAKEVTLPASTTLLLEPEIILATIQ